MTLKDWSLTVGLAIVGFVAVLGLNGPTTIVEKIIGSASSPSVIDGCMEVNGHTRCYNTRSMNTATTTPLAIRSPQTGTSTLALSAGCRFTVASTSAKQVRFARATTGFATTTYLFGGATTANGTEAVIATTTTNDFVFAPGQYLVMSMVGGTGTDSPTGKCNAVFELI